MRIKDYRTHPYSKARRVTPCNCEHNRKQARKDSEDIGAPEEVKLLSKYSSSVKGVPLMGGLPNGGWQSGYGKPFSYSSVPKNIQQAAQAAQELIDPKVIEEVRKIGNLTKGNIILLALEMIGNWIPDPKRYTVGSEILWEFAKFVPLASIVFKPLGLLVDWLNEQGKPMTLPEFLISLKPGMPQYIADASAQTFLARLHPDDYQVGARNGSPGMPTYTEENSFEAIVKRKYWEEYSWYALEVWGQVHPAQMPPQPNFALPESKPAPGPGMQGKGPVAEQLLGPRGMRQDLPAVVIDPSFSTPEGLAPNPIDSMGDTCQLMTVEQARTIYGDQVDELTSSSSITITGRAPLGPPKVSL